MLQKRNAAKITGLPANCIRKCFGTAVRYVKNAPGIGSLMALRQVIMEQSDSGGMLGKGGFLSQLKRFITGPDYFADGFQSSYGNVLLKIFLGDQQFLLIYTPKIAWKT